jgi:hypothetical protein
MLGFYSLSSAAISTSTTGLIVAGDAAVNALATVVCSGNGVFGGLASITGLATVAASGNYIQDGNAQIVGKTYVVAFGGTQIGASANINALRLSIVMPMVHIQYQQAYRVSLLLPL